MSSEVASFAWVASAVAGASVAVVAIVYMYWKNKFNYWASKGIKGPPPIPFVGNYGHFIFGNRMKIQRKWRDTYGYIYGIYRGAKPTLVVSDPEVVRQISIKDFDKFPNHELGLVNTELQKHFIFFMQDDHWKRVRAIMSPTFTSSKMRRMFRMLDVCAEDLIELFKEQFPATGEKRAVVNLKDLYMLYTMDGITTCGYGMRLDRSGAKDVKTAASRNDFVLDAYRPFDQGLLRTIVSLVAPRAIKNTSLYQNWQLQSFAPLMRRAKAILEGRRKTKSKFEDYVQLLLDAELQDTIELDESDRAENHHAGLSHESLQADQKRMVEDVSQVSKTNGHSDTTALPKPSARLGDFEILANVAFLLMVGLETTATLLTHMCYTLGFHQDVQERLHEEISKIAERDESKQRWIFNYETLTSCQYLDAVISETLRTLSPVLSIDRESNAVYTIAKYGITIPKGQSIMFDFHGIHSNSEFWPDPLKFDPDRFMPGNKEKIVPGSYIPFGIGPRHCIGMRFSLTEAKLAMAKLLMEFKFEPAPETVYPPEPKMALVIYNLKKPYTSVVPRT